MASFYWNALCKTIGKLNRLNVFHGTRRTPEKDKQVLKQEFLCLNRSLEKITSLKDFSCSVPQMGQVALHELMTANKAYQKVTKVKINCNDFDKDFPQVPGFEKKESSSKE